MVVFNIAIVTSKLLYGSNSREASRILSIVELFLTTGGALIGKIFISYRRDDASGWAGRLYNHLFQHFSQNEIFMDVDAIEFGFVWSLRNIERRSYDKTIRAKECFGNNAC